MQSDGIRVVQWWMVVMMMMLLLLMMVVLMMLLMLMLMRIGVISTMPLSLALILTLSLAPLGSSSLV